MAGRGKEDLTRYVYVDLFGERVITSLDTADKLKTGFTNQYYFEETKFANGTCQAVGKPKSRRVKRFRGINR